MNWFRGDGSAGRDDDGEQGEPSSTPDANELRRRRLAKLEEAQAAEKARRKELEERRAKWEAEKAAREAAAPKPPSPPPVVEEPKPEPIEEPQPKRPAVPLPSVEAALSKVVAKSLGIAVTPLQAIGDQTHLPELIAELRAEAGLSEDQSLFLTTDMHADDILINRINAESDPLAYVFSCYTRCGQQTSEINSNRRIAGEEHNERRSKLHATVSELLRRVMTYAGMLLNGSFMETDNVKPEAFAQYVLKEKVPSGFIRSLLHFYSEQDGPGLDDILPVFSRVFKAIRDTAKTEMKLSSSGFLRPLNALVGLFKHKELCVLVSSEPNFVPKGNESKPLDVTMFNSLSFLAPFFAVSALPGLPVHMPTRLEDPAIATSMFPNPTMLDRATAEGTMYSLRSSLSVARSRLHQICLALCKGGPGPRNAVLSWFATVLNLNKKRSAMQVDYKEVSGDGFILNVMHVLLKLCEPIVDGGWKMLQKIDPTFPQSSHRLDYEDETRLAADSDMLKRWWVDKRNENAQESLTRQLEAAARESGVPPGAVASSQAAGPSNVAENAKEVASEFSFVTECFWLALRSIHVGFIAVENMYEETILRTLQRMKDVIDDMEAAKEAGTLPPRQMMQLAVIRPRRDSLASTKLCYDVYLQDPEMLTSLIRFAAADAEWLMKKLLSEPPRESLLPLPVPADPTFASLPEHTVEAITTVLLTTMRFRPDIVDDNSSMLDDIVSFCIAGSASPLHVKNPYLRAKLVEFLWTIFPRGMGGIDDDDEDQRSPRNPAMEALFSGHELSRKFLPGALFRLYVDVEHTGSHTQFYDKFSIRYRIGSIIESLWYISDYRKSVRNEARDEARFLRFVNMVLNDANHLLDSVLDDLEEMHSLEMLIKGKSAEWEGLSDEEKEEKQDRLKKLEGSAKTYNQLANSNVKLLWLLTDDEVVRRIFLRDEMVNRLTEMLNYLLVRLCGQRCRDLKVSEAEKVSWKPRQLLTRIIQTYVHFHGNEIFAKAVGRDGRSYKKELLPGAIRIGTRRRLVSQAELESLKEIAEMAEKAVEEAEEEEGMLGEIPDEFLDPIMSSLMRNPVRLPTSGNVMDRAVISRILLSDKVDPFNRKLLTEDMLEEDVELKARIDGFIAEKRREVGKRSSS